MAEKKSPVEIASITDNLQGPYQRSEVTIQGPLPSDVKDEFHFVLLQGEPLKGRYDWFKISRKPNEAPYFLVLGSNDGRADWVEDGQLSYRADDSVWTFEIVREVEAEGEKLKIVRRFSWRKGEKRIVVTIAKQHRYFLNPAWSRPSVVQYTLDVTESKP